jgi:hypothetical protein
MIAGAVDAAVDAAVTVVDPSARAEHNRGC